MDSIPMEDGRNCIGGPNQAQYQPFVIAHTGPDPSSICPSDNRNNVQWYLDKEQRGCCNQNSYLAYISEGIVACCACGATCSGTVPQALQNWQFDSKFLLIVHIQIVNHSLLTN